MREGRDNFSNVYLKSQEQRYSRFFKKKKSFHPLKFRRLFDVRLAERM